MAPKNAAQSGNFELGPVDGNCLEGWSQPDTVENAHDQGNRPVYKAPVNNNSKPLSPAPEAQR